MCLGDMMREIIICILLAAVLLAGPSCAPLPQKQPGVQSPGDTRKAEIEGILAKADEYVAKGDFKNALDFHKSAAEKYPGDETLEEGYIATVEDIKKAADKSFEKGDFTLSGKTYYLLLKSVRQSNGLSAGLSFTKKSLTERLDECRTALSQQALSQYREGNIGNAISLWKSILSFDPGNKSIKKAIDTATTQLKNLKQK
jgi:tetratricopeptide (TPR) repeat protein